MIAGGTEGCHPLASLQRAMSYCDFRSWIASHTIEARYLVRLEPTLFREKDYVRRWTAKVGVELFVPQKRPTPHRAGTLHRILNGGVRHKWTHALQLDRSGDGHARYWASHPGPVQSNGMCLLEFVVH
jgi:hypothetical protein